LAYLTQEWEQSIAGIDRSKTRVVVFRIGLVLGKGGGLLSKMTLPFKFFAGGHFGDGKQWMSWIHRQDVVGAIQYALKTDAVKGDFNLAAPEPVQSRLFFKLLGKSLHRPSWFHMPEGLLLLFLGEMARETLLTSQKISSQRLQEAGYRFQFSDIEAALQDILGNINKNG
jgi:uncharacterized protein (TIGR01777 family)